MRRVGLQNRHTLGFAVGGRRGREHDVLDAVFDHALEHCPRAAEVIIIILERIHHALADLRVCGKVNDRVDLLAGKDMVAERLISDVALIKPCLRMYRLAETGFQIVRHNDIIAIVNEFVNRVAANVTRAAEY